MVEVDDHQLKEAIAVQHGGNATLGQSVTVRETFKGQPLWEGIVHKQVVLHRAGALIPE